MSKLLFIASDWQVAMIWPGGIAAYIECLTQALRSLGDTVKLLAVIHPDEEGRTRNWKRFEPWVIPFPMKGDDKPTDFLRRKPVSALQMLRCVNPRWRHLVDRSPLFSSSADAIHRLQRVLAEERPDAVVLGHFDVRLYPLALCLQELKLPYVIVGHDRELCPVPGGGRHDSFLRGMMIKRSSWIAANSRHTASLIEAWKVRPDQIRIIYPPISQEAMKESSVLDHPPASGKQLTLITICRLVTGKGIDLVLHALKILDERGIPYQYLVGGDGPEKVRLGVLADALRLQGAVTFEGSVVGEDKWRLLRMADVFVLPSRFEPSIQWQEGFGIALVEAAAFGLPAIGSTSGGIPDAVIDGETGVLVPEESPQGIADALTLFYRDPEIKKRMGKAGRERARSQFSPEAIATNFRDELAKAARS